MLNELRLPGERVDVHVDVDERRVREAAMKKGATSRVKRGKEEGQTQAFSRRRKPFREEGDEILFGIDEGAESRKTDTTKADFGDLSDTKKAVRKIARRETSDLLIGAEGDRLLPSSEFAHSCGTVDLAEVLDGGEMLVREMESRDETKG